MFLFAEVFAPGVKSLLLLLTQSFSIAITRGIGHQFWDVFTQLENVNNNQDNFGLKSREQQLYQLSCILMTKHEDDRKNYVIMALSSFSIIISFKPLRSHGRSQNKYFQSRLQFLVSYSCSRFYTSVTKNVYVVLRIKRVIHIGGLQYQLRL